LKTKLSEQQIRDIIVNTTRHHLKFLQRDGGFSRTSKGAIRGEWPLVLGKGLAEGDTNAGTQAMHTVRSVCYELAGRKPPKMAGADRFYARLGARRGRR
jgi:hypothetical protein